MSENFKCNVDGCKYKENWDKMCPNNMMWLDINYHFVKHHPELHSDMGKHILMKVGGEWKGYNKTMVDSLKKEIDGVVPAKKKLPPAKEEDATEKKE